MMSAQCRTNPGTRTSPSQSSVASLTSALGARGLDVKPADRIRQPFFSVPATVFTVDGDDLQVYEYPSSAAAASDAAKISPSGTSVGTAMVNWMQRPHVFRRDNLIVIYIGNSAKVRQALAAELGPQIAGGT